jgi:hypothetical protein
MTKKAQLYPWCIIRPFPNMRTQIVGRFRNRSDAEGHLQILKRLIPNVPYQIMFDITPEPADSENLTLPCLPENGGAKLSAHSRRGTGRELNPME